MFHLFIILFCNFILFLDVFSLRFNISRKIVSWVLTKDMTAESVLEAIKIAQERRNIKKPVIIHSDYAEEKTIPKF